MSRARSTVARVAFVSLGLFGCSTDTQKNPPASCPASSVCAEGTAATLSVGEHVGDQVTAFTAGQQVGIIYGPQGGQHFWADLSLATDEPGEWTATLTFADATTGALAGSNTRRIRACSCPTFADDIPVFLDSDNEVSGTLKVSAESPSGQLVSAPDVQLTVTPFL
jgi:hypothetical protein